MTTTMTPRIAAVTALIPDPEVRALVVEEFARLEEAVDEQQGRVARLAGQLGNLRRSAFPPYTPAFMPEVYRPTVITVRADLEEFPRLLKATALSAIVDRVDGIVLDCSQLAGVDLGSNASSVLVALAHRCRELGIRLEASRVPDRSPVGLLLDGAAIPRLPLPTVTEVAPDA